MLWGRSILIRPDLRWRKPAPGRFGPMSNGTPIKAARDVRQAACWQPHERGWAPEAWHHVSGQWLKQFPFHFCTLQRSACNPVLKQHWFSPKAVAAIDDTIVVIAARSAVVANDTVSVTATLTASRHLAFVVLARERNLASIQYHPNIGVRGESRLQQRLHSTMLLDHRDDDACS